MMEEPSVDFSPSRWASDDVGLRNNDPPLFGFGCDTDKSDRVSEEAVLQTQSLKVL